MKSRPKKANRKKTRPSTYPVMICMGSQSDWPIMKEAAQALSEFRVSFSARVISAHRTPKEMFEFAEEAYFLGYKVIIAGAGGAAHLPGMLAAISPLPVIGVPVPHGTLSGQDALLSIVQMPKGVPVATVAIGNAYNAGLLAVQILSVGDNDKAQILSKKIIDYRNKVRKKVIRQAKLR